MSAAGFLREIARRICLLLAKDVTATTIRRACLVVAPHPDDETLGCGATLILHARAGTPAGVVVLTDGRHSHKSALLSASALAVLRADELHAATQRMGMGRADVLELGFEDGSVQDTLTEVSRRLAQVIADRRPDDIFVTCRDEAHPDHASAAIAVRHAVRASAHECRLYEYPIWLWSSWPVSRRLGPGRGLVELVRLAVQRRIVTVKVGTARAGKRHALNAYTSQLSEAADQPGSGALPPEIIRRADASREMFFRVMP